MSYIVKLWSCFFGVFSVWYCIVGHINPTWIQQPTLSRAGILSKMTVVYFSRVANPPLIYLKRPKIKQKSCMLTGKNLINFRCNWKLFLEAIGKNLVFWKRYCDKLLVKFVSIKFSGRDKHLTWFDILPDLNIIPTWTWLTKGKIHQH